VKDVCWRIVAAKPSGEGYELCGSVHAEIVALLEATRYGMCTQGATARIYGQTWVCPACLDALKEAGVERILIRGKEYEGSAREDQRIP